MTTRTRRRKHKFIACLLTAIFPGLGHLYLKQLMKGIMIIYFILIDASALIYFSSVRMGINVPFLILLGLLIPVVYFYSVYDVLQSTDLFNAKIKRQQVSTEHGESNPREVVEGGKWKLFLPGFFLIVGGSLIFLLSQKPPWLEGMINWSSGYIVSTALILFGVIVTWRETQIRFVRIGRFTAASVLLLVGGLLLSDVVTGHNYMLLMLRWWPLILIIWGFEYIFVFLWKRKKLSYPRQIRIDIKGLLLSICIGISVFIVSEHEHYLHLWNRVSLDLAVVGSEFSNEEGFSRNKLPLQIPIDLDTNEIIINGINGNIEVKRAEVEQVVVRATVWVDQVTDEEGAQIVADTSIEVSEGKSLTLSLKDRTYGESGKRHPRVNLAVILPNHRFLDLDISTSSGDVTLTDVQALKQFKLQTGNGKLKLWNVVGDVSAKTLNGGAELHRIFGAVSVETHGGNLKAKGITGDVSLSTVVGDISVVHAEKNIRVNTKNGNINVDSAPAGLHAESLNGKIVVSSRTIGGNWYVYSAVGDIYLEIPLQGDYSFEGNSGYGTTNTNLPFYTDNKMIRGYVGASYYKLKVEGNSNVFVNKS